MFDFLSLIKSKADFKLAKSSEVNDQVEIEKLFSIIYLLLLFLYTRLVYFLTQFWPFSLFWRNKNFHFENRFLSRALDKIEVCLKKMNKPFEIVCIDEDRDFYNFTGKFSKRGKFLTNEELEKQMLTLFNFDASQIFVRSAKQNLRRILIDKEALNED